MTTSPARLIMETAERVNDLCAGKSRAIHERMLAYAGECLASGVGVDDTCQRVAEAIRALEAA